MTAIESRLRQKGWTEEEISKTAAIMDSIYYHPEKHTVYRSSLNPIVYWSALLVTIIGNFIVSIILIPFLLILKPMQVYFVCAFMAFMFGYLFTILLRDIENVDHRHHIIAGAFIPAIAVITMFVMVDVSNNISRTLKLGVLQNPVTVSIIYVLFFVAPYILSFLVRKHRGHVSFFS